MCGHTHVRVRTEEGRATVFFRAQNFELFHYCSASYFCLTMNIGGGRKVMGRGEPFRERLIIVLKKTAFLSTHQLSNPFPYCRWEIVKSCKLDGCGEGAGLLPGCAVWKSKRSMLIALLSCTLILCFPAPKVFAMQIKPQGHFTM